MYNFCAVFTCVVYYCNIYIKLQKIINMLYPRCKFNIYFTKDSILKGRYTLSYQS